MFRTDRTEQKRSSQSASSPSNGAMPPETLLRETHQKWVQALEEQKRLQAKLEHLERDFHTIFDSVPAMIWYRDRQGTILRANRCAAESVGLSVEELIGKNYYELFPDGAQKALEKDMQVILSGQPLYKQLRKYVTADNRVRWVLADRIPYWDENGQVAGVIVFAQDITEQKTAEDELHQANRRIEQANRQLRAAAERARILAEEAAAANRAKSEFLAHMSHELRTPMNAILGFADILQEEALTEEQRQYVQTIQRSASNLLTLINEILDFSKIEAGKLHIEMVPCSCAEVVREAAELMEHTARSKGLEFRVDCSPDLPGVVYTDPMRLRQCLLNLLGNAVKFTEKGFIAVRVYPETAAGQKRIRFDVQDTGIGIEPAKQSLIFESFTQADSSICRKYGGTGLGLAITRRLMGLLGGHVELASQPGKGSTFSLILPCFVEPVQSTSAADPSAPAAVPQEDDRHIGCIGRVLLLDSDPPNPVHASLLLRRAGLDVCVVQSLREALEGHQQKPFNLALIALQKVQDARKAAARLRNADEHLPIVVITGDSSRKTAEQFKIAGCNAVLVEPVSRGQLYETLRSFLSVQAASSVSEEPAASEAEGTEDLYEALPVLTEQIRECYARSDYETLANHAGRLVELGRRFRRSALADKAGRLQKALKGGTVQPDELQKQLDELNDLCLQIMLGR